MRDLRSRFEALAERDEPRGADVVMRDARNALDRDIRPSASELRPRRLLIGIAITLAAALVTVGVVVRTSSDDRSLSQVTTGRRAPSHAKLAAACATPPSRTPEQLQAIRDAVEQKVGRRVAMLGTGMNAIVVGLWPGQERKADHLLQEFGNEVEVQVASRRYCGTTRLSPKCPPLTGSETLPAGVHLQLRLSVLALHGTDAVDGRENAVLAISNDGPAPFNAFPAQGQPLVASIVRPGTQTVVGRYRGLIMGMGFGISLVSGQTTSVPVIVSAWRCDGRRGSRLPPGVYGVRAGIGPQADPQYLAPEESVRVTR